MADAVVMLAIVACALSVLVIFAVAYQWRQERRRRR